MPTSSAFCSPVEQSSAGIAFGRWRTRRSERCGPSSVRPAARSRSRPSASARRNRSSTSTAGSRPICASSAPESAMSACGKGPSSGSRSIIAASSRTSSARAAAIATPVSAICVSIASNQASVARVFGEQPVAAAHRLLVVERPLAMAGVDRQHQPVEEAPPVAGRPGEQRVHRRRQPDDAQPFEHVVGRLRRRAVDAHAPAGLAGPRAGRAGADLDRRRTGRRGRHGRRSRRRCLRARRRHRARGAGRARASAGKSLPADWSCRRRCRR